VVEAGLFTIAVGSSSRDLPLSRTIEVEAPSLAEPLSRMSTLHEWRADPLGCELLEAELANGPLANEEFVNVVGTMPLDTLASFGLGLTHSQLDDLVDEWRSRSPASTLGRPDPAAGVSGASP
jgi:beta-glucosidase